MPVELISFEQALHETSTWKRHLLLGNGFSIALFSDRFRYVSLLEMANFDESPEARQAFDVLATADFEVIIKALRQAAALGPLYDVPGASTERMGSHAETLKEILVSAIAGRHPERPSEITEEQFASCRAFLANFIGESRDTRARGGPDVRGCVYTLNYDLLLYWTLLHDQIVRQAGDGPLDIEVRQAEALKHDDGFRAPDDDPEATYVAWDGEDNHSQCIYFLHGGLHLFDYGFELQKLCWERSGGAPLVDQIRLSLDEGRFPLFVSEGESREKFERIRHSAYLHKGLRSFAENCRKGTSVLFIFGHSLADSDDHILDQIAKGRNPRIYVSLFGELDRPENVTAVARAEAIARRRPDRFPLEVRFFDAASAKVWG